jgi:hypothetical protein
MPQDLEALWSIRFGALYPTAQGPMAYQSAGVVVLETGKLFGGDSSFYYLGSYVGKNGLLTAKVTVTHYTGPPQSILGLVTQPITLVLQEDPARHGQRDAQGNRQLVMWGDIPGQPGAKLVCELTWRAALPG